MDFSNRYRWSLSTGQNVLGLEHLRYGNENPVKLLELAWDADLRWKTSTPHTCNKDTYTLEIIGVSSCIHMDRYVTGPVKNECIFYRYH